MRKLLEVMEKLDKDRAVLIPRPLWRLWIQTSLIISQFIILALPWNTVHQANIALLLVAKYSPATNNSTTVSPTLTYRQSDLTQRRYCNISDFAP